MKKIKIMTVFGTRPEAIKLVPLIKEMGHHDCIESVVCVTAQHREMLDQVLTMFDIHADYDLDMMQKGQTLTDITVKGMKGLEEVLEKEMPNLVLVHGDTSTSFIAALAAFYKQIKVGHVEAGLRTFNKYEPFPEEMNRRLTGVLADLHFAPTEVSKQNLLNENIKEEDIFVTGNTAIDMLKVTVSQNHSFSQNLLNRIDFVKKRVLTITAHRRENLGEPLQNICLAVRKIVEEFEDVEIVYAVHPNPQVKENAQRILGNNERIHLIEPLHIRDMHNLLNKSYFVMTDSGGMQEEVPSMGKPVLVLRNVTERPEGVSAGTLKIAGVTLESVYESAKLLLTDNNEYQKMSGAKNPFGDGFASKRIVESIINHFKSL